MSKTKHPSLQPIKDDINYLEKRQDDMLSLVTTLNKQQAEKLEKAIKKFDKKQDKIIKLLESIKKQTKR